MWEDERERQCPILERKNFFVAVKRGQGKDFFKSVSIHMHPSFPGILKKVPVYNPTMSCATDSQLLLKSGLDCQV